jgi:hypothetical protein
MNMADAELELADVRRYREDANEAAVSAIVKHLGIALLNPQADSALVSASDGTELLTVRESWLKKKLGLTDSDSDLDTAIGVVAAAMQQDKRKRRVTFYYLLAEHYGKLDSLA